jgi:hypothetical protein
MRACQGYRGPFRVVQPWGRDKGRQATVVSTHDTAEAAFTEIDHLAEKMAGTGAPSDAVELIVVDRAGAIIARSAH